LANSINIGADDNRLPGKGNLTRRGEAT